MKKIGLLGGTFDPIHNGHLIIAEYLRDHLSLDEIWFIPARYHALKPNADITSPEVRYHMVLMAIEDNPFFKGIDIELKREGISYTVDTLTDLIRIYQDLHPEFYLLMGMDNVNELHRWKEPQKIFSFCKVIAFGRPDYQMAEVAKKFLPFIRLVEVPLLDISSTLIRQQCREGRSIRYLVPEKVRQFIVNTGLYRSQGK